jgi:hypothetical protein
MRIRRTRRNNSSGVGWEQGRKKEVQDVGEEEEEEEEEE